MERESFAEECKLEAASIERSDEAKRAFLSAFIRLHGKKVAGSLRAYSESAATAKLLYTYLNALYGISPRFAYSRGASLLKRRVYWVILGDEGADILSDLEIDEAFSCPLGPAFLTEKEHVYAYLAGAFLASGSVNGPYSQDYHLEFSLKEEEEANRLAKIINKDTKLLFSAKVAKRRNRCIVYLKKGEEIATFLSLIGANENCLKLENVRVDRDFSNITNRLQNLDAANYGRTNEAAKYQFEAISYLEEKGKLEELPLKLQELIKIRKDHPEASMQELSILLSEELNTEISKSNVNHLFRYLKEVYENERK